MDLGGEIKKYKKHKKKHKKYKESLNVYDSYPETENTEGRSSIRLKIKIGNKSVNSPFDSFEDADVESDESKDQCMFLDKKSTGEKVEEEEWLQALEDGTLDDNGDLRKKQKEHDPSLLTARQRARLYGNNDGLLELPSGYKKDELTEEQLQKKAFNARKRREREIEKKEKDKKSTMERLLKKQESKLRQGKSKSGRSKRGIHFQYITSKGSSFINVPLGFSFPLNEQKKLPDGAKLNRKCEVKGCGNPRKYSCSKTGKSLCSLECYKRNLHSEV